MIAYVRCIECTQNPAEKWMCRVLVSDGETEETHFLKFQDQPSEEEIAIEAQKLCTILNNPPTTPEEEMALTMANQMCGFTPISAER